MVVEREHKHDTEWNLPKAFVASARFFVNQLTCHSFTSLPAIHPSILPMPAHFYKISCAGLP